MKLIELFLKWQLFVFQVNPKEPVILCSPIESKFFRFQIRERVLEFVWLVLPASRLLSPSCFGYTSAIATAR